MVTTYIYICIYLSLYIYIYIYILQITIFDFLVIIAFGNLWGNCSTNMGASLSYFILINLLELKIQLT